MKSEVLSRKQLDKFNAFSQRRMGNPFCMQLHQINFKYLYFSKTGSLERCIVLVFFFLFYERFVQDCSYHLHLCLLSLIGASFNIKKKSNCPMYLADKQPTYSFSKLAFEKVYTFSKSS